MTAPTYADWAASKRAGEWQPIETAPRDGTYILLKFDGPFRDSECPGVAVGKAMEPNGWWLTAIWAASIAHQNPSGWSPITPASPGTNATGAKEARGGKVET